MSKTTKPKLVGRDAAEKKREEELVKLRKKYLVKKGKKPAAKKKTTKPKLVGREAVEAKRQEKLEALRKKAKARKSTEKDSKFTAGRDRSYTTIHKAHMLIVDDMDKIPKLGPRKYNLSSKSKKELSSLMSKINKLLNKN